MNRTSQEIRAGVVAILLALAGSGTFLYVALAGWELPQVLRWCFGATGVLTAVSALVITAALVEVLTDMRRARRRDLAAQSLFLRQSVHALSPKKQDQIPSVRV